MARTGCAFAAVTCLCCPARTHRDRQVLPAYGLQDLPIKTQNPSRGSKPNTMWLPITLGESLGRGHFYLAETRTFLLCVDRYLPTEEAPAGPAGFRHLVLPAWRVPFPGPSPDKSCLSETGFLPRANFRPHSEKPVSDKQDLS